ncbi:MAG: hypothetical protein ACREXI_04620 [Caldimonas sp.]
MNTLIRSCVLALAACAACTAPLQAEARPGGHGGGHSAHGGWGHGGSWHRGGGWGHSGRFWGGIGLGLGLGALYYGYNAYPGYVVAAPLPYTSYPSYAPYYYDDGAAAPSPPVARAAPDPIVYPRNGQSPAQTEADRRACDRWAMTQPNAMADASVFQRATLACMDGRGYTVR